MASKFLSAVNQLCSTITSLSKVGLTGQVEDLLHGWEHAWPDSEARTLHQDGVGAVTFVALDSVSGRTTTNQQQFELTTVFFASSIFCSCGVTFDLFPA